MTFDEALRHATKLLAGRDKSSAQLAQALERKGASREVIEATLERCRSLGYLDDRRLAVTLAREALEDGWVGEALSARLEAKGFAAAVVTEAIATAQAAAGTSLRERARALVARKKVTGLKAARFLASRGFPEEEIEAVVGPDLAGD
ncbi:MAG: regulatory protein RecX [Myxococcaceae bacterium]